MVLKYRSSTIIIFRRKEYTNKFNFEKKIYKNLKIFIFSSTCFICAQDAFLQGKPNILYL